MIPISRPQIVADEDVIAVVYRDKERNGVVTLAYTNDGALGKWKTKDLTAFSVDAWEPSLDNDLWQKSNKLHLFVQPTSQGDGEVAVNRKPTNVYVLETDLK